MDADASAWTLLAAVNRWALYAFMLIGVGSALFVLVTPTPQRITDTALTIGRRIAPVTALTFIFAVGFGGAEMMAGGLDVLWTADTWSMAGGTSLGQSALIGVLAMSVLWTGCMWRLKPLLAVGVAGGILSFLVTGHAATANPVWLASTAVGLHLVGAAYWIGALYPLFVAARDGDSDTAAGVIVAFSYRAVGFVSAIVASGIVITWIQLADFQAFFSTQYGARLIVKLGLFGLLIALAAYNKLSLTPRILSGSTEAMTRLRQIIRIEYALIVLVLGAAVTLTLTEPPRALEHGKGSAMLERSAQPHSITF